MYESAPCMLMRGGTSKGAYFLASDLPANVTERDAFLLRVMGSPDNRQIDGIGGADPLTSKIAIVKKSERDGIDVDYLFLQVFVDQALVSDAQNCGNILAGVGPFAIERGLVKATGEETEVSIYMDNTAQVAVATIQTPESRVTYSGNARIDGVPGYSSPIPLMFANTAGSMCGSLLPTGNQQDIIDGVSITCIDNGMPTVVLLASDFALSGEESREELEANDELRRRLESIRLQAGRLMGLGDVTEKTVPKMSLVSRAKNGGCISTRTFIPHRCHASIGVLGAVSVATACMLENSVAHPLASTARGNSKTLAVEHPSGETTVILKLDDKNSIQSAALLRTARKLFDGNVFAHQN